MADTTNPAGRPSPRTDAQLRSLVAAAPRTPGRETALAELVTRAPRGLDRYLTTLALDPALDQGTRVEAVAALGRATTAAALAGLREALTSDDDFVTRRAIERLGKVGERADLDRLRERRPATTREDGVLRTAKIFLSYRHRLGAFRVDAPKRTLAASEAATDLQAGPPSARMRERVALLPPRVPGIALAAEPAREIECGAEELAVSLVEGVDLTSLDREQAVVAVVSRVNDETGALDPAYYLLADPVGPGRVRLSGVRGSGAVVLAGTATLSDGGADFTLAATERPAAHPFTVTGRLDGGSREVRLDTARADVAFAPVQQGRRRTPRPARPPV